MEVGYAWIKLKYEKSKDEKDKVKDDLDKKEKKVDDAKKNLEKAKKSDVDAANKELEEAKEKYGNVLTEVYFGRNDKTGKLESVPVVLGPDKSFYIIDDHHSLSTLDYSGDDKTMVYLEVDTSLVDLTLDDFWKKLESTGKTYLGYHTSSDDRILPSKVKHYTELPTKFSFTKDEEKTMADDPWRSLAGYSRKVEHEDCPKKSKKCLRCMCRSLVSKLFFEFRWGYFMQYASYSDLSYWPSTDHYQEFSKAFSKLKRLDKKSKLGDVEVKDWERAAELLVPLCRSSMTGTYELPEELYPGKDGEKNYLPGYFESYVMLPDDPNCPSATEAKELKKAKKPFKHDEL